MKTFVVRYALPILLAILVPCAGVLPLVPAGQLVESAMPPESSSSYSTILDLLLAGAQAKYGDLPTDYHANNHKHIGVLGGSFVIGGSLYIDLDDYAGITIEGQGEDGYVTVWVNAEGGFRPPMWLPINGFAGFRRIKMKTNEPDPRLVVDFHVLDMDLPLFSFTAVSVNEHGDYSYDDIQGFQGIGLNLQIISARFCVAKFEVKRSVLQDVFSWAVDAGYYEDLTFLPDLVSVLLAYNDTDGISLKQPIREFTTSDAGAPPTVMAHINYLVGGMDVDGDGRRDNVYPVTTDQAPADGRISMTMATTGTQTADYRIQLIEDSVPAGWHIEADLDSGEHGQTEMHLMNEPPHMWITVHWYASCLSGASNIAEISFEVYQRKLLADVLLDIVHVTFYKQESASPSVSIIEPSAGRNVTGEIQVAVQGTDNAGICKMTFSSDGDEFGLVNIHPAISPVEKSITWDTSSYEGDVTLEVTLQDPSGNEASDSITVNVDHSGPNVPPYFEFVRPSEGATSLVQGDWYTVRWIAEDPDNDATIRLYIDTDQDYSSVVGLLRDPGGIPAVLLESSPGDSFIWDTSSVSDGTYYVVAEVVDGRNPAVIVYSDGTIQIEPINPGNHFELADMSQWQWDDDFSVNDQDYVNGIPEGLETLELKIPLRNKSGTDCQFVHTALSSTASPIDFSDGDEYENYGNIDAGQTVVPDGHFEFRVTSPSYTNSPFYVDLRYEDTSGNTYDQALPFYYTFPVQGSTGPILNTESVRIDDAGAIGGVSGTFESGERIDLWVTIANTGTAACVNPRGILEQSTAWGSNVFSDLNNEYSDIPAGESRENIHDYDTYYAPRCFAGVIPLTMHVEYGPDRDKVQDVTFMLTVTPAAYMEIRDSYYFGIASPGDIVEVPLTIYSDGSAPLQITSITTGNPDSTVSGAPPTPFTMDPCSDQIVTVNIDTTDDTGAITRVVTVTSSNAYFENTQTFTITGLVGDCFGEIMIAGGDGVQDEPHVYGDTLVYHEHNGTDSYIVARDLVTGTSTILTPDTNYRHWRPRIYENYVVFAMRPETGTTNDAEIYLYDLDDIMTPNPKRLTNDDLPDDYPRIWGDYVMWQKRTSNDPYTRYDVFLYSISTESMLNLTNTPAEREDLAELHGNYAVWINDSTDTIYRRTLSSGYTEQIPKPAEWDSIEEVSNYDDRVVFTAYIDVADPLVDDYYDVFLYDGSLTNISNDHDDIDEEDYIAIWGDNVVYMSNYLLYRIEIGVTGSTPFSCDPAMKSTPFIHEDTVVWEDYRNSKDDIYMKSLIPENLAVTPDNISFDPTDPVEGETVTVTALINNLGESIQNDVVVRFYEGDPDTSGTQIGSDQTIPTIPAGGTESAAVDWSATAEGPIPICVVVDPDNAIPENNEVDDNKACKEVPVTDNDTDGPTIDDVGADEYSGDGDGLIEDVEQVRIQWTASDPSGIGDSSCTVSGTPYSATGSYEIIVGPFSPGTYNFTIEAQDADNSPESTQETGSFTVYTHAPTVVSVSPSDGEPNVSIRPAVEAEFSEPLDPSTVNDSTVTMQDSLLGLVPGDISYDVVTNTMTFVPSDDLCNSQTHTMTLLGGVGGICAENGNSLESPFQWSFTTEPDTTIPDCIISTPGVGQSISGTVEIRGTAWDRNFDSYQVFYGSGSSPSSWIPITSPIGTPVLSNTLCQWNTAGLADGEYSIQLRVHDQPPASNQNVCNIVINKNTGDVNNLEGQVWLQGRPVAPHASWITDLTVSFLQGGMAVTTENVTTDNVGNFTIADVAPGIYDICVKSPRALSELETGVVMVSGTPTSADFGTLREGDANNDDAISLADYALLYAAYGSEPGDGDWNDNCDFNRNEAVDLGDYALLYANYGQVGDCYAL